jgi:hypothetical protein
MKRRKDSCFIRRGAFYTFDLWTRKIVCVAEATLVYVFEDDKLFYTNIDHEEFVFDFKNHQPVQAT